MKSLIAILCFAFLLLLVPAMAFAAPGIDCVNEDITGAPPPGASNFEIVLSGDFQVQGFDCGGIFGTTGRWVNTMFTNGLPPVSLTYYPATNQSVLEWTGTPTAGPTYHLGFMLIGPTTQVGHGLPDGTTLLKCWTTPGFPLCNRLNPYKTFAVTPMVNFTGGNPNLPPQFFTLNWVTHGVMDWFEVQMPNGATPMVQFLNPSGGPLTVSGAGTLVTGTYYPLDQLNLQDLPPSDFNPDPALDGVVAFNASPEPGTLLLVGSGVIGTLCRLRRRKN